MGIDRSQIIEITSRKIVVQDPLQVTKAPARTAPSPAPAPAS
jgi:hypothetical protein